MSIIMIEQFYDKKKNKFSVTMSLNFRVNFVKSVMFFQSKITKEAYKETTMVFNDKFHPLVLEYFGNFKGKFARPIPKTKKKLTKFDKLAIEFDEYRTQQEETTQQLNSEHQKELQILRDQIEELSSQNLAVKNRLIMAMAAFVIIILITCLYL